MTSIFISYRHDKPWTRYAKALHLKLRAAAPPATEVFIDTLIPAGGTWQQQIDESLARCTHFVALLCDDYWVLSSQCLRELYLSVGRWEASGHAAPKLLFVQAGSIRPERMTLDAGRASGALVSPAPELQSVGDINFLGPFDANGRLETLASGRRLDLQLAQLRDRLLAA